MSTIVYIDDEPLLCRVFARIFEDAGRVVVTFTEPREALAYIATHPVAAIVCDYRMPSMTGLQVLAELDRQVPFFLVTGDLAIAEREGAGVTGVLTKPFEPERLLELVTAAIG